MSSVVPINWTDLRRFTPARVGLGRAGSGLPTSPHLAFQAAHAAARDAVHAELDVPSLRTAIEAAGFEAVEATSAAPDRRTYLMRPDLGRRLSSGQAARLPPAPGAVVFIVADGLSAVSVQRHAPALLGLVGPALQTCAAPVVVARQARVALGDEIGAAMGASAVVVLIGERPGLSAADSLSAYLTWDPRPGRTDAERNCISNIRPDGFPLEPAARKILWLLDAMRTLRLSGVALKDEEPSPPPAIEVQPDGPAQS